MLGAVIGDMAGSIFERHNHKTADIYDFPLLTELSLFTDDTVMTLAVARAVLSFHGDRERLQEAAAASMRSVGREFLNRGYGGMFKRWLLSPDPKPYQSYGNGAAMRVSPCGAAARSEGDAIELSRLVTVCTHDHPEGIKGAEAAAVGVFLAGTDLSIDEIRARLSAYYPLDFTLDAIRGDYRFDVSCQGSVPQALTAFLEAGSFEEAVRLAISIGGDSDTIAAIAGSLAEARWGIPESLRKEALGRLPESLAKIAEDFERAFPPKMAPA